MNISTNAAAAQVIPQTMAGLNSLAVNVTAAFSQPGIGIQASGLSVVAAVPKQAPPSLCAASSSSEISDVRMMQVSGPKVQTAADRRLMIDLNVLTSEEVDGSNPVELRRFWIKQSTQNLSLISWGVSRGWATEKNLRATLTPDFWEDSQFESDQLGPTKFSVHILWQDFLAGGNALMKKLEILLSNSNPKAYQTALVMLRGMILLHRRDGGVWLQVRALHILDLAIYNNARLVAPGFQVLESAFNEDRFVIPSVMDSILFDIAKMTQKWGPLIIPQVAPFLRRLVCDSWFLQPSYALWQVPKVLQICFALLGKNQGLTLNDGVEIIDAVSRNAADEPVVGFKVVLAYLEQEFLDDDFDYSYKEQAALMLVMIGRRDPEAMDLVSSLFQRIIKKNPNSDSRKAIFIGLREIFENKNLSINQGEGLEERKENASEETLKVSNKLSANNIESFIEMLLKFSNINSEPERDLRIMALDILMKAILFIPPESIALNKKIIECLTKKEAVMLSKTLE